MSHGVDGTVKPQRQSDGNDVPQHVFVQVARQQGKFQLGIPLFDVQDAGEPGGEHGNNGGQGGPGYVHAQNCHKNQVKDNIDNG